MTSLTRPTGTNVDYTFKSVTWAFAFARLSKYVEDIDVDPLGGGAFTTTYTYGFTGENVTTAIETRADGSKPIVDFFTSGDEAHLRETETWTDKDGTLL